LLKNKHQAVSQGVRRFGKRSLFSGGLAFAIAAQRRITASDAAFNPVSAPGISFAAIGLLMVVGDA
jgi:hypothetical protein